MLLPKSRSKLKNKPSKKEKPARQLSIDPPSLPAKQPPLATKSPSLSTKQPPFATKSPQPSAEQPPFATKSPQYSAEQPASPIASLRFSNKSLPYSTNPTQYPVEQSQFTTDSTPLPAEHHQVSNCPPLNEKPKIPLFIEGAPIALAVLYEDDEVLVIDKAQGLAVHPATGHYSDTLVNALLYYLKRPPIPLPPNCDEKKLLELSRPGIVHRLDKETSGVIITAKTPAAEAFLMAQFKEHTAKKEYICIAKGAIKTPTFSIDFPLTRHPKDRKRYTAVTSPTKGAPSSAKVREAHTRCSVIKVLGDYTLLKVHILTGRTHQIRVHLKAIGHPLLGDAVYNRRADKSFPHASLMLHARALTLTTPDGAVRTFKSPLPARFWAVIKALKRK